MRTVLLLALKDLRLLLRDRLGAFFTFAFPVIYAVLFGLMFSGAASEPGRVRVTVVDRDGTEESRAFIARLVEAGSLDVELLDDEHRAFEHVRLGQRAGAVVLPQGFGASARQVLAGQRVRLTGLVDPAAKAEAAVIRGVLTGAVLQHIGSSVLGSPVEPPVAIELGELSAAHRRTPPKAFALTFSQGAAWGLMACAMGSSLSLVSERSRGTLSRLTQAPVGRWQVLAGKALACFAVSLAMMAALTAVVHLPFFGVRPTSYPMLLLAAVCSCAAFVGIMMTIASFGRTVAAVEGFGRAVLLVLALVGGAAVPVLFMPGWMRVLADLSPFRWAIAALDGAVWRGFGPAEMLLPCGVLLAIAACGFLAGVTMFRFGRSAGA
jgi:ABC-2 type transport system permease protein